MNRPTHFAPTLARRTVGRVLLAPRRGVGAADVPVIVLQSTVDGPTVVITANLHGDETTGLGVVRGLDTWLRTTPFRGRVVLYPSCNPQGLRAATRAVPSDEGDLNRSFPGDGRGGPTARLADALWQDIVRRAPDAVLDLHADSPDALPYVIVDRPVRCAPVVRARLSERLLELAEGTGLTVLREYPDDAYLQFALDRSLAGAVVNVLGVPAITLEVGPRRQLDPRAVDQAMRGVLGALGQVGVLDHVEPPHATKVVGRWRRAPTPRARVGGIVARARGVGDRVRAGERLATLHDLYGDLTEEVLAVEDALVVSWVETPWVAAGGLLGTLGVTDGGRL